MTKLTRQILTLILAFAVIAIPAAAYGDPELGQVVFKKKCFACHKVGDKARSGVGPVLNDLFGRRAGTAEGFARFTDAMKGAGEDGLIWDADRLREYLPAPRDYVKGTSMFFVGLAKPEDIENLIAYLSQFSPDFDPAAPGSDPR